jgi:sugar O-acyltransferase (sialic acid O-acetyltransferase NeuD family)
MILYGGSGHAKVIRDCIRASGAEVSFIFDDNPNIKNLDETSVVGPYKSDFNFNEEIIISIGDNQIRKKISEKVVHKFGKTVHPSAILSSYSKIDEGTVIMNGGIVNAGTKIGKHCIINTAVVVEHDCVVEDFVHLSPNVTVCGNVSIGEGTHIGACAVVIPNLKIGKWCVIGAGAVVTYDIPDYSLVVGVPGKVIRNLSKNTVR